ncbi:hypothetical protein BD408DRAFT_420582 [Parasitella parasitica]|nr:hypothetical protein BD408DRAFT_420582 [Parasitella parasitica]
MHKRMVGRAKDVFKSNKLEFLIIDVNLLFLMLTSTVLLTFGTFEFLLVNTDSVS